MQKILIAGGTGLVGAALTKQLKAAGHQVAILTRHPKENKNIPNFYWNPIAGELDEAAFEGVDTVINLAGAGIADARWTKKRKKLIIESRVKGGEILAHYFSQNQKPSLYIAASAIGYYGDRNDQLLQETDGPGNGFLSESCKLWEAATQEVAKTGVRCVTLRIGIVFSTQGGALSKMLPSYNFFLGTYFGDGSQYYSWIHIDDLVNIIEHCVDSPNLEGVFNAVGPTPATSKEVAKAIKVAGEHSAVVMPAPAFALNLVLGEMSHVVLDSTRVSNAKIEKTGFKYMYPALIPALTDLLQRKV